MFILFCFIGSLASRLTDIADGGLKMSAQQAWETESRQLDCNNGPSNGSVSVSGSSQNTVMLTVTTPMSPSNRRTEQKVMRLISVIGGRHRMWEVSRDRGMRMVTRLP